MTEDSILKENFNEYIMQKIDDLTKAVSDIQISIAGLPEKIFEKADKRYASKTSEKVVYGMVGAIILGALYAILKLVYKM